MATAADPQIVETLPDIAWRNVEAGEVAIELDDGPSRKFSVLPFHISRYPITNEQYQCFINAGGYDTQQWWKDLEKPVIEPSNWQHKNRPRTNACWYEAMAYCRWLTDQIGDGIKITLPEEQQWLLAATGGRERPYPWPDQKGTPVSHLANVDGSDEDKGHHLGQTSAVGLYPNGDSATGISDLAGNVWEWCLNRHDDIDYTLPDFSEGSPGARVLRGGSWLDDPENAAPADRRRARPGPRSYDIGFRLVCALP